MDFLQLQTAAANTSNAAVAMGILGVFHDKAEPLPYLPDFVLPPLSAQAPHAPASKIVAHVGCGQATVHAYFLGPEWQEVRVDISPGNQPHIIVRPRPPPRNTCP